MQQENETKGAQDCLRLKLVVKLELDVKSLASRVH